MNGEVKISNFLESISSFSFVVCCKKEKKIAETSSKNINNVCETWDLKSRFSLITYFEM